MKQMSLFDTPNIKGVAGSKKAIRSDKNIQRSVEVSKKKKAEELFVTLFTQCL